jgi:hypothetical protein
MRSQLGAFFELSFFITTRISFSEVKNFVELFNRVTAKMALKNSFSSSYKIILCGFFLNNLERCIANVLAFSSSLLVASNFLLLISLLSGRYCVCGHFSLLVAFHKE